MVLFHQFTCSELRLPPQKDMKLHKNRPNATHYLGMRSVAVVKIWTKGLGIIEDKCDHWTQLSNQRPRRALDLHVRRMIQDIHHAAYERDVPVQYDIQDAPRHGRSRRISVAPMCCIDRLIINQGEFILSSACTTDFIGGSPDRRFDAKHRICTSTLDHLSQVTTPIPVTPVPVRHAQLQTLIYCPAPFSAAYEHSIAAQHLNGNTTPEISTAINWSTPPNGPTDCCL